MTIRTMVATLCPLIGLSNRSPARGWSLERGDLEPKLSCQRDS